MSKLIGKWDISYNSKLGEHKAVWIFEEGENGAIIGIQESENMTDSLQEIKADDDRFEFFNVMDLPMGKIKFRMFGGLGFDRLGGISKSDDAESIISGIRIPTDNKEDKVAMKKYKEKLNLDGKFDLEATLYYTDSEWRINYFFAPMKQDVTVTGTVSEGRLAIVTDSCGYCEPMLPLFQSMYEHALTDGSAV
jgi:hypothetical protein